MPLSAGFTRREFLGTACSGLAGLAVKASNGGNESNGSGVHYAVMLPQPGTPIRQRALLVQHLGYQGIELSLPEKSWEFSPAFLLNELRGINIAVSCIGGACQLQNPNSDLRAQGIERDRKCLELAKVVGATQVGEHYLPRSDKLEAEDLLVINGLKQLAPHVQRTGVQIVLEPLSSTEDNASIDLQSHGVRVLQAFGAPGIKLVSDFNHMQREHNDIGASLARLGGYTGAVHLPGLKRIVPGSELFDYRAGLRALKDRGYSGWLTVECGVPADNPAPTLARALQYVQEQWREA